MLHGIYGRGRNWQVIARRLVEARPEYRCLLVDLPHHGESHPGRHGPSVAGLADDLDDWLDGEGMRPDALLGHSFGGKIAIALAARRRTDRLQVWIVDSTPATRPPGGDAWQMLQTVRDLPDRFASRDDAVEGLAGRGWARPIAQWMATNLERDGDGFVWRLDFTVMEQLLRDFFAADLWSALEEAPLSHAFRVIKATRSDVLTAEAIARLETIGPPRVELHRLEGGHWIHAEKPDAVVRLLQAAL